MGGFFDRTENTEAGHQSKELEQEKAAGVLFLNGVLLVDGP